MKTYYRQISGCIALLLTLLGFSQAAESFDPAGQGAAVSKVDITNFETFCKPCAGGSGGN